MNRRRTLALIVTIAALLLSAGHASSQQDKPQTSQGTYGYAFTYQGQLNDAGGPVNGTCDLRFALWDAANGGSQVGNTLTLEGVEIKDGLFTAKLDFGSVHSGAARWLAVAVRCPAGSGAYVTLNPRQELTGAPAALSLALPFAAEANLGGPLAWFENDGAGEAAGFSSQGGSALWVDAAGLDGLRVASAGQDGVRIVSTGGRGLAVDTSGGDGLFVNTAHGNGLKVNSADANGLQVDSAGSNGVFVNSAGGSGLAVDSAGSDGVFVGSAGDNGVYVGSVGSPSTAAPRGVNNGFAVGGAQGHGLYVGRADGDGVFVNSAGGTGVYVNSTAFSGVHVDSTGYDGVVVHEAGNPSTAAYSTQNNGFEVAGAEGHGLYVGQADGDGVSVNSAGSDGVYVSSAHHNGVFVNSADRDGVIVQWAGSPLGGIGSELSNGFEVLGAEGHGLFVGLAGHTGVLVNYSGWNGVVVEQAGGDGVRATATVYNALYGDTANAQGEWGLYTPDKVHAQNVTLQTLTLIAQVTGPHALSPGDVVAAAGVAPPLSGKGAPLPLVRLAAADWNGIVGVVEGRLALSPVPQPGAVEGEPRLELRSAEGPAPPGEYVALTILGVSRVKVDVGQGIIQAGTRLTSDTGGRARALKSVAVEGVILAESAPALGIALTAPDGDGLVWVLVNPQ